MSLLSGKKVLALSGGVGGAKLALGLAKLLPPEQLTVVCNTADDFEHLGLPISPDLDTVMYTLAGLNNTEQGWGLAGESWQFMAALETLGGETWFRLGDKDLATHVRRRQLLDQGYTLSEATEQLCRALDVCHGVVPMSDQPVRTVVDTDQGKLPFQHYFVREQCQPKVSGFRFDGIETAHPSEGFLQTLQNPELGAVVICPSNPFVSVDPILRLPGVRNALQRSNAPVIAVSPIVGGKAIKGPAAKMLTELGLPCTAQSVVEFYGELLDGFVLDSQDAGLVVDVAGPGRKIEVVNTVMNTLDDRVALANAVLDFIARLNP